jgi:hypothetical protein
MLLPRLAMPADPLWFQEGLTEHAALLTAEELASLAAFADALPEHTTAQALAHQVSDFLLRNPAINTKVMPPVPTGERIAGGRPTLDPAAFKQSIRNTVLKAQGVAATHGGSTPAR